MGFFGFVMAENLNQNLAVN